jgi:tetratricopeptide (TPR) repeat protein
LRNEYEQAVEQYLQSLETGPVDTDIHVNLGRCYRILNSYRESEEILQNALDIDPFHPDVNYEMALVCQETGKEEKALTHLKRVLSIWENADADFEPAIRARELLSDWEGG